jgi:4-amino-4-deoxy-L-arabinose transferase-like glycosyltransferase
LHRARVLEIAGAAASVGVAVLLYTRYHLDGTLARDEAIYAYGGQQMTHGVAPYASIFDPKGPLASMVAALGAGLARLFGTNDLTMIRLVFFTTAVLSVLAIYLLVVALWNSVLGGLSAAVVFACFRAFAQDAVPGPDAKTPAVLLIVLTMWLLVRRRWLLAGFAAASACLVWQPLFIYPIVAVAGALLWSPRAHRQAVWRVAAGLVTPVAATLIYFAAEGALGTFAESAFAFPLTGVHRTKQSYAHRLSRVAWVVNHSCKYSALLFWVGMLLLVAIAATALVPAARSDWHAALAEPLFVVVVVPLIFTVGYSAADFQSYPDLFPLLPFPAIGCGAAVALGVRRLTEPARQVAVAATLAAAVAATALSAVWFSGDRTNDHYLRIERAAACAVQRIVPSGTPLYALGNPVPLVLTHRRNPDRFIYLESGVAAWKVDHTSGGFGGWTSQIRASGAAVIIIDHWTGPLRPRMDAWLTRHGYSRAFVGPWRVFVTPAARDEAAGRGVRLTATPTRRPRAAACRAS